MDAGSNRHTQRIKDSFSHNHYMKVELKHTLNGQRMEGNGSSVYTLSEIFGGVTAITKDHFLLVNGFSNAFFGWGGEDDDIYNRIKHQKLKITRYPLTIARYAMLSHGHKGNKPAEDR